MSNACSGFDPLDDLVESFLERYRGGERPSPTEYASKHPELAERIRSLFPSLVVMEELASGIGSGAGRQRHEGPGLAGRRAARVPG